MTRQRHGKNIYCLILWWSYLEIELCAKTDWHGLNRGHIINFGRFEEWIQFKGNILSLLKFWLSIGDCSGDCDWLLTLLRIIYYNVWPYFKSKSHLSSLLECLLIPETYWVLITHRSVYGRLFQNFTKLEGFYNKIELIRLSINDQLVS